MPSQILKYCPLPLGLNDGNFINTSPLPVRFKLSAQLIGLEKVKILS